MHGGSHWYNRRSRWCIQVHHKDAYDTRCQCLGELTRCLSTSQQSEIGLASCRAYFPNDLGHYVLLIYMLMGKDGKTCQR